MALVWGALGAFGQFLKVTVGGPTWLGMYAKPVARAGTARQLRPRGPRRARGRVAGHEAGRAKKVDDLFLLLRTPVGQEQKLIDAGVPIVYAGQTQPNYWETNHPRLVHWGGFLLAACICAAILGLLQLLLGLGR